MATRLEAAIIGDLREHTRDEWRIVGRGVRGGLTEGSKRLRDRLKGDARSAGLDKLGRAWKARTFRGRGGPANSLALVYPKGGERTRGAIQALEDGATIRPKNSRYLAIPTQFNRKGGRKGGKVLFQPDELKDSFVQRSKSGALIIFGRVNGAQRKSKGRVQNLAFVGNHLLGSGRRKRSEQLLKAGMVPMFILKRQVRVSKKLNSRILQRQTENELPGLIIEHIERADRGQ